MTKIRATLKKPQPLLPMASLEQTLKAQAASWIQQYQQDLDKWGNSFKEDPARALEWASASGHDIFNAAARVQIAHWVLSAVAEGKVDGKIIVSALARQVQANARNPERSTAISAREMAVALNAARAHFIAPFID